MPIARKRISSPAKVPSSLPLDEDAWEPPSYSYYVEREANAFAAALLMDERRVREDFAAGMRGVGKLADRYGVSSEAMGFRLANIRLV